MEAKKKEQIRAKVARQISRENHNWSFNGREFEMTYRLGVKELSAYVKIRSRIDELTVSFEIDFICDRHVQTAVKEERFVGIDCFEQAVNWITDLFCERLERSDEALQEIRSRQNNFDYGVLNLAKEM